MTKTALSLLEQMKITDYEINRRLEILSLDRETLNKLSKYAFVIEKNIDFIVNEFYKKQTEIDEISLLIGDSETLSRLRSAQRRYVLDLFSGSYDGEYVNNRLRIGLVHKRIGVEPKLYLAAVVSLKIGISEVLSEEVTEKNELVKLLNILDRLITFDTTLVFDTYIASLVGEIQIAKDRAEFYAENLEIKIATRTRQLEELSQKDSLTGLLNHRVFQERLRHELLLAMRRESSMSLVFLDIDDFKCINDEKGHLYGDNALKCLGNVLKEVVRSTDIPCRYGGDEFAIILPDCSEEQAKVICQKIIEAVSVTSFSSTLSIGIKGFDWQIDKGIEPVKLIELVDKRMYAAKGIKGSFICASD